MIVTIKEQKNAQEYQETINIDIEDISSKKQPFWTPIYEVIEVHILKKQNDFQPFLKPIWK